MPGGLTHITTTDITDIADFQQCLKSTFFHTHCQQFPERPYIIIIIISIIIVNIIIMHNCSAQLNTQKLQEHSESTDLCQDDSGPDLESISGVRIRIQTLDPDDFQNLMGTSLFKVTFVTKFS